VHKIPLFGKNIKRGDFVLIKLLNHNIEKLIQILQKSNLQDISMFMGNRKRMLFSNFFAGIFRGMGFSIGFTLVTAIVIIILQRIVLLNIPIIGEYLNDIIAILEMSQQK